MRIGFARRVGAKLQIAAALTAGAISSFAATPGDLALGLQGLYWGISPEEVAKLYPALGRLPVPNPNSAGIITMSERLQYAGCDGQLALHFYKERLSRVRFDQVRGSSDCREHLLSDLQGKFGPAYPRFPGTKLPGENLEMRNRTTIAHYLHTGNTIGGLIVDMQELFDNSGERSAALAEGQTLQRKTSCQSIHAEFIAEPAPAIGFGPTFAPTVSDLNCEYPDLAVRLFLRGRVVLRINILADGTLASGVLVTEAPRGIYAARLADAAINIATEKLRYSPAMKDGVPVASEAHLAIDFQIIHPFRGVQ